MGQTELRERPTTLDRLSAWRRRVRSTRTGRLIWRGAVTLLGLAVVAVGIVLLPFPGPGWLIIFAGLGILASEYEWAARLLRYARERVRAWTAWVARQRLPVKILVGLMGVLLLAALGVGTWLLYY